MNIEVRHARIVSMLAKTGSISKAAAELALPQPSLSLQLRRIEKAVGGALFVRSPRGITPTPLGERLNPMLTKLVTQADDIQAEASSMSFQTLRIGVAEWTPVTLRRALRASLPSYDVQTVTLTPDGGAEAVSEGLATAALVRVPEVLAPMRTVPPALAEAVVTREPVWLALPPDHPFTGRGSLDYSELSARPWVRYARGHWSHTVEEHLFRGFRDGMPEVVHYARGQTEAMSWVREAAAVALVSPTGPALDGNVIAVDDAHESRVLLMWRRGAIRPATLDQLLETIRRDYCDRARMVPRFWSWLVENAAQFPELKNHLP